MSLNTFFLNDQVISDEIKAADGGTFQLNLGADDLHHANVLRLHAGEHIGVCDSGDVYYECEVVSCDKNSLQVKNSQKLQSALKAADVWLCPGLAKGSKVDDVIRAATEIGIAGFIPVQFSRSVVKLDAKKLTKKLERWQEIAKSAAMQSGAHKVAQLNSVANVNDLCKQLSDFDEVIVF